MGVLARRTERVITSTHVERDHRDDRQPANIVPVHISGVLFRWLHNQLISGHTVSEYGIRILVPDYPHLGNSKLRKATYYITAIKVPGMRGKHAGFSELLLTVIRVTRKRL